MPQSYANAARPALSVAQASLTLAGARLAIATAVAKQGGVPIIVRGTLLGAIGVSGASSIEGTPARGSSDHSARYGGATYWFTSEAHRAKFESDPARHAPAFGGFCGYAASIGVFAPVNPLIYIIQTDRLVLQHTPQALELYKRDPEANLRRADENWPSLVARAGL